MQLFVEEGSIVRRIWGTTDTILFIFAGAAAEFALNKAVDWLYFTGKLPADPLGRLFSTVGYARRIVFSAQEEAHIVIDRMAGIHATVERNRGARIPDWAYRDVLYMLIDYSVRSWELLHRRLALAEKVEVYEVFRRVGERMGIADLPENYDDWLEDRARHLNNDLAVSSYTIDLYNQYRKHLGWFRYHMLRLAQGTIVPTVVRRHLRLSSSILFRLVVKVYTLVARLRLDWHIKKLILPRRYVAEVKALDMKRVPFSR